MRKPKSVESAVVSVVTLSDGDKVIVWPQGEKTTVIPVVFYTNVSKGPDAKVEEDETLLSAAYDAAIAAFTRQVTSLAHSGMSRRRAL